MKHSNFSRPVVVEEGVAFRVKRQQGHHLVSKVVIATKARLRVSQEAQGLALLAAFAQASSTLFEEAVMLLKAEVAAPILYL